MVVKRRSFAQARKAAGFTQEDLAERLGVDRTTVARWEAGEYAPQPWQRPRIAEAFGLSPGACNELLEEVEATGDEGEVVEILPGVDATLSRIECLRRNLNGTITETTMTAIGLDDWEQTVFRYGQVTRERAPSVLLGDLSADLGELHRALVRCRSSSALRRLTRCTAQMAGLMCTTLIKMDEQAAFRGWARTAQLAADGADDPLTYSWVRAQEAYGYYYGGDFTEAIYVAQHAQVLSGQISSVGFVLAAALEARAQAALGQTDEARAALHRAETCLSRMDADGIGTSAFHYNEAQLRFHEGNTLTHLHDTDAAWQVQQRALSLCPASDYMDRAMTRLDRAHCLAYDGDVTAAVGVMEEAMTPLSDQQRQGIIALRVRGIVSILPLKYRALPAVQDLQDLLPPLSELED